MSGIGFNDEPESGRLAAPTDPTARWDDEGYNRGDDADAFGAGHMILNHRCGYVFHVSCWILLEKVFHPALIDCARLYEVCASLPRPEDFFSWGHDYGGLVAHHTINYFPWNYRESFIYPELDGGEENTTPGGSPASFGDSHEDDVSLVIQNSTDGSDRAEEGHEDDTDGEQTQPSALDAPFTQPDVSGEDSDEDADDISSQRGSDGSDIEREAIESFTHADRFIDKPPSRLTLNDNEAGSSEVLEGSTTPGIPSLIAGDQRSDGDEDKLSNGDNTAGQEQLFSTEDSNALLDNLHNGQDFVQDEPSLAGVLPRLSPSDSQSDYFPSDESEDIPRLPLEVPSSDPFDIPDVKTLLMDNPQSPPVSLAYNALCTGDAFAALPEEIRTAIAKCLLTSDALSLRSASRCFWHIFYSQQFWKSRFSLLYSDRSWLFEALDDDQARDWRYLYRKTSNISSYPALQNRKRVWNLAICILDILNLQSLESPEDQDSPATGHIDTPDKNNLEKIEVAGRVHYQRAPRCFLEGCRVMHRQRLSLPDPVKLSRIAFSFVRVGNTSYISGLRFVTPETSQQIGYRSPTERSLTLSSCLKGWRIAVGPRGVQAIQCLFADEEADSPWFGSLEDACITNRLADSHIQTVDFGLDVKFPDFVAPFFPFTCQQ